MRLPPTGLTIPVLALLASAAGAQQPQRSAPDPHARLLALAGGAEGERLARSVRDRPDEAREVVRRLLVRSRVPGPSSDSTLQLALRLARAYASAWEDSFPLAQVERFARMDRATRFAKVAADSLRRAGNGAFASEGVQAGTVLWREALARSTAIGDSAGAASALGNIGSGFFEAGALDSADAYLQRARSLAEAVGDRRTAVNALGTLGSVARARGDMQGARERYVRALEQRARIGDARGTAADHNNLGLLAAALGDVQDARRHYEGALRLARRHLLDEAAAAALLNLANLATAEGEYVDAARRYGEALALYRARGSRTDEALTLHNLGLLALRRGDYREAAARLRQALALFQRTGAAADVVLVRRDLASVAMGAGDLRGAMEHLRRAEAAVRTVDDAGGLAAGVLLARADLAVDLNDPAAAERLYARAEERYRAARDDAGIAEARHGRAMLLLERGRHARAVALLEQVAAAQTVGGERRSAALTRSSIGVALHRSGEVARARVALAQAVDSLQALGDPVAQAAALAGLGDVEREAGEAVVAEAHYRRGLALLHARRASPVRWRLHAGLGRALQAQGALAPAATSLRAAVADIENIVATLPLEERRAAFLADKWDTYGQLALVERTRGDAAASFDVSERLRARQMLDLLARGRVARGTPDSALVGREQDLRRRIGQLAQRLEEGTAEPGRSRGADFAEAGLAAADAVRESLVRAQEQYAQLLLAAREDGMSTSGIVRGEVRPWREVAARLAPDEAFIEYLVTDSASVAFVVRRDSLHLVELGAGRRSLESLVDFARGALAPGPPGTSRPWRAPLRRLHDRLVAPLEHSGALDGARRLVVAPHLELHYLPFAALVRDGAAGARDQFLVERYELAYAPSASVWLRLGDRARTDTARRAASRDTDRVLALAPRPGALPASRREVEAIRALYGARATVLTGAAATEKAFRAAAGRHAVVHLATRGVLNKHNPLFSYVSLHPEGDDGRLEVHEVFDLALHARLLVLSACQTGLGSGAVSDVPPGDDWISLVRAFLGAGAANVVATLWPVEDAATAHAMERMYRRLHAGEPESAALAGAQRDLLRNPATADPFHWAGFVLVGGR